MLNPLLFQYGVSIFPFAARFDLAAKLVNDRLHPIANTEHGEALVEHPRGGQWRARIIDACRATGKDHALWIEVSNFIPVGGVLNQLAIDVGFPDSPCYQTAVLGTEVDDQDRLALIVMVRPGAVMFPHWFLDGLRACREF